jgi:hypothetical protein
MRGKWLKVSQSLTARNVSVAAVATRLEADLGVVVPHDVSIGDNGYLLGKAPFVSEGPFRFGVDVRADRNIETGPSEEEGK